MSKPHFIISIVCILSLLCLGVQAEEVKQNKKKPIVITSRTLTADNKSQTALFEGSVVATTENVTMNADKMTVSYDTTGNKISRIHATGSVKVYNDERVIFSDEAIYYDDEEKIVFKGNPKAVEGDNFIAGKQITFFLNDNRAVIDESKMILQDTEEMK